ncbi:hypothetical protein EIN_397080 [Entamoeba invadens IP1]|uniref:Uncharacterized protein n=1 Tax=Entamoeba invadens IP1 TaxID=370355 RepID=A0A0A1U9V9_ENTIV|nr:hypothetical protein EIN_397080 [Entamoeba invadens IP1]ELP91848.1 hypothetical protein EIN_397080 [Entamoeba invadens IP1]|eukprot:XP_004258619.1 hypothetical protein EIN_397080 [Entamoeba invadens IP1]
MSQKQRPISISELTDDPDVMLKEIKFIFVGEDSQSVHSLIDKYIDSVDHQTSKEKYSSSYLMKYNETSYILTLLTCDGRDPLFSFTTSFFKNTNSIFLVYTKSSQKTADHLEKWKQEINRYADTSLIRGVVAFGKACEKEQPSALEFCANNTLKAAQIDVGVQSDCVAFLQSNLDSSISESPDFDPLPPKKKSTHCCVVL